MKEQIIEKVVKEVNGYIADDGTWFRTKEECQKYEESAKMVLFNMVKDKIIAETNIYNLLHEGNDDDGVEIYNVDSLETLELLNRYIMLSTYDKKKDLFKTDMIGKKIIVFWSYDRDYCWSKGTIEDLLNGIKERYDKVVNKTEN